jgi:hypothetical protein
MENTFKTAMTTTLTENGALSYNTTTNARVDLFFKLTRDFYQNNNFKNFIEKSLNEDKLDTLKIIFNGRDSRGGKGDRESFLQAQEYLRQNYTDLWYKNVHLFPEYGRYSDWYEKFNNYTEDEKKYITELTVKQLKEDYQNMNECKSISLLAKWIPSEDKRLNRSNLLIYICSELFDCNKITGFHLKKLRKEYITPLRAYLNIVESLMCQKKWDEIDFSKVPSCAMHKLKKAFERNSPYEFSNYLQQVESGQKKINASQIFPHDLVRIYLSSYSNIDRVAEAQWNEIVTSVKKIGTFNKSLVISDVSGSMTGTPMEVSIALGILIANITKEPFNNCLLTFSENPVFHIIPDNAITLKDKVDSVSKMGWGMTTNLTKVFDLILQRAINFKLKEDDMPEKLYIISDMQFNQTSNNQTNFEYIDIKYKNAGYKRPQIIFWNVRSNTTQDFPVDSLSLDVALISGFSPAILKSVINGKDFTPYGILRTTIDDERYSLISI